jgi:hemerythrin superfamily protein
MRRVPPGYSGFGAPEGREVVLDATKVLEQDHRGVEQLFDRFEQAEGDTETKGRVAKEIVKELSIHAAIEEEVFYPEVKAAVPNGGGLVDHSLEEHQEVKELLAELDSMDAGDAGFHHKMEKVISHVKEHVEEEEGEMFPKLREAISANQLLEIGDKLEKAKKRAPTRPHPKAPNRPPANKMARPPAAVFDKARDKLEGRESA